jgi:hypothetical protein
VLVPGKLSQPSLMFVRRPEAPQLKYLSGAPLWGRLQPTNIRLGWKGLTEGKTLTIIKISDLQPLKKFYNIGPRSICQNHFTVGICKCLVYAGMFSLGMFFQPSLMFMR